MNLFVIVFYSLFSWEIYAQTTCTGAIGDLIYSPLIPSTFIEKNGDCWELFSEDPNWELINAQYGVKDLNNPEGYFIRTHDGQSSRLIGSIEGDQFLSHSHDMVDIHGHWRGKVTSDDKKEIYRNLNRSTKTSYLHSHGGTETRPLNRNYYLYIRTN